MAHKVEGGSVTLGMSPGRRNVTMGGRATSDRAMEPLGAEATSLRAPPGVTVSWVVVRLGE
jgi:hypothetical protein